MRHLVLVSLLVFTVTFSAGCTLSGSKTALTLRRDAAAELKLITERSTETDTETESSSQVVHASFTTEANEDSEAFPIDTAEVPDQPEWWNAAETETYDRSFEQTTLSAQSTTTVTTKKQTGSWKPKRDWTATKPR